MGMKLQSYAETTQPCNNLRKAEDRATGKATGTQLLHLILNYSESVTGQIITERQGDIGEVGRKWVHGEARENQTATSLQRCEHP